MVRETDFRDLYRFIIRTLHPGIKRKTIIIARIRVSKISNIVPGKSVVRKRANRTIVSLLVRNFLHFSETVFGSPMVFSLYKLKNPRRKKTSSNRPIYVIEKSNHRRTLCGILLISFIRPRRLNDEWRGRGITR